ncbi:DUF1015 domain-containing protein [Tissierella creatinophila]|uniref:DUF1015 domain-containing protein n=1 Tax=Tissierella creatinophila DSM 6911 TaxID=1123403 RepID=A0A1U7M6M6_TISCR|nr:DUF1015 family protein [Tissierella creatinophila]OLS02972.1 hypothetical protein TICRE_10290 [Tissierella creatinophila DSM 6911]
MAILKPFKAYRPTTELADKVAALPYDVMNSDEARKMVVDNPYSFLHVDKAEIDLDPNVDIHDRLVYEKARENLQTMIQNKILIQDKSDKLYIYKQVMDGRSQIGLVGCTAIDDYLNDTIKKHEYTRPDKEQDRINHVDYTNANTGPIFLTYKKNDEVNRGINNWINTNKSEYDFTSQDGIQHTVWVIDDNDVIEKLTSLFQNIDHLYIADGHHRSASAAKVGLKRREEFPNYDGTEEFNFFLSVIFPDEDLYIMDYNRVVKDLNGLSTKEFIDKIKEKFEVKSYEGEGGFKPQEKDTFGMYLDGNWYELKAKKGMFDPEDPVERLDVSILQNNILDPILGIKNPRTDTRIDFVGGLRGLAELESRVSDGMKVAFSMYPTTIDDLIAIADAGKVMPPKSTWFEPKLRSGLFIHEL